MISRAVGCLVAILVAIFALPSPGSAVPEISVTTTYAYDSPVYDAPGNDSVQERGPPSVSIANTTYDAIGHWSRGTAARPDGAGARPTITHAYPGTVVWVARSTTTTSSDVVLSDGDLLPVPASRDAAKTGPSNALRPVGSVLESVDDVIANPQLLAGKHPAQVESILRGTPGWEVGTLGRGRSAGSGWTFRQLNARGTDYTDLYIQWSPGSPRHFGGAPYWKVSSGTHGTQWIQQ